MDLKSANRRAAVHGAPGQENSGTIEISENTLRMKLMTGGLNLIGCWILAVLAIAVPVVHFFLVPGLLLAGVLLALRAALKKGVILNSALFCPACSEQLEMPTIFYQRQLYVVCPKCSQHLSVDIEA